MRRAIARGGRRSRSWPAIAIDSALLDGCLSVVTCA
jgi:hypothetical protein